MAGSDTAIVQCVDRTFLPYALALFWQIDRFHPGRSFDLVIASIEPLEIPPQFAGLRIEVIRHEADDILRGLPTFRIPTVSYLRLYLPKLLGARYRRLLYLDADIFYEGGDLGRLAEIDLGPHAVAGARAAAAYLYPDRPAEEFKRTGMGNLRYINTGVMVIDTARWTAEDITGAALGVAQSRPDAMVVQDQSLLNLALAGRAAEISPVWNWVITSALPFVSDGVPVRLRHFIRSEKPWADHRGVLPRRFHEFYAEFFRAWLPEAQAALTRPPPPRMLDIRGAVARVSGQIKHQKNVFALLDSFRDEWEVKV